MALLEALILEETTVMCSRFAEHIAKLRETNALTGKSFIETEFGVNIYRFFDAVMRATCLTALRFIELLYLDSRVNHRRYGLWIRSVNCNPYKRPFNSPIVNFIHVLVSLSLFILGYIILIRYYSRMNERMKDSFVHQISGPIRSLVYQFIHACNTNTWNWFLKCLVATRDDAVAVGRKLPRCVGRQKRHQKPQPGTIAK